ncbi:MAG: metallophosphoesterase [Bacteroidia bacterium]
MDILLNDDKPVEYYPYLEVGTGLDQRGEPIIIHKSLPIYVGEFSHQQTVIDYLILCSDLQGVVQKKGDHILLGKTLPEFLRLFLHIELAADPDSKVGVLLCGDLYANLEKRGASGDAREVWITFKQHFDWVAGVAGNHDTFGTKEEQSDFQSSPGIHLLHKEHLQIDGLSIGGISGIIGRKGKPNRVEEGDFLITLKRLLKKGLDLVLLHETPDFPELGFIGNPKIREVIEQAKDATVCCGHCFWGKTIVKTGHNTTIMNLDSKVVILKRKQANQDQ